MARGLRQRAFLAPARHAAINQPRVARRRTRDRAQPLHHAWPKTFDQRVGALKEVKHLRDRGLVFQIEFDDLAPAPGRRFKVFPGAGAIERDHLRAHICQQHAGERAGSDAGEFDDANAGQRPAGALGGGLG